MLKKIYEVRPLSKRCRTSTSFEIFHFPFEFMFLQNKQMNEINLFSDSRKFINIIIKFLWRALRKYKNSIIVISFSGLLRAKNSQGLPMSIMCL